MESFAQWIQSIVIYLLLVSLVYQIFPDSEYKKYMKVCTGLILMLVAVWPLVTWSGSDDALSYFFDLETMKIDARDFEMMSLAAEEQKHNAVTRAYKTQLEQQIYGMFQDSGIYPVDAEISIVEDVEDEYYGSVKNVYVTVAVKETAAKSESAEDMDAAAQDTAAAGDLDSSTQNTVASVAKVEVGEIEVDGGIQGETSDHINRDSESRLINDSQIEAIETIRQKIADALYVDSEHVYINVK